MLVIAKKSLCGTALIVAQLKVYRSWNDLNGALIEEFDQVRTSKEIHSLLSITRKREDESLLAYSVRMQELAVQGGIEDSSLVQYIIDGISDTNTNKILLYGASNMQEFKRKLNVYKAFKTQAIAATPPAGQQQFSYHSQSAITHTHNQEHKIIYIVRMPHHHMKHNLQMVWHHHIQLLKGAHFAIAAVMMSQYAD